MGILALHPLATKHVVDDLKLLIPRVTQSEGDVAAEVGQVVVADLLEV